VEGWFLLEKVTRAVTEKVNGGFVAEVYVGWGK
jgi:hypothetical protein